ncbi:hypothetical protein ACHAO5_005176 [Verticillium nonalfalfae]
MTGVTPSFMDELRTMIKQEIAGHLTSMDPTPSPAITPPALMNSMFDLITPDKMQNFYAKYRVENEEFPLQGMLSITCLITLFLEAGRPSN